MSQDEAFLEKLKATFQIEASEHIKALSDGFLLLEKQLPPDQEKKKIEEVFREAHSLKGAARAVNLLTVQEICQELENVLAAAKAQKITVSPSLFDVLHKTLDLIQKVLSEKVEKNVIQDHIQNLKMFLNGESSLPVKEKEPAPPPQNISSEKIQEKVPSDKTIRVHLSKLDRIFQEVEEMLMVKLVSKEQKEQLKQLSNELYAFEKSVKRFLPDNHAKELKSCNQSLRALVKGAEQNTHLVAAMVDTLLEDAKKILVQPISSLFEPLPRMVRDLAQELKKEIDLEFQGGDIEIDRRILEEIKDPIIHLIRNAVDHGIESPEARVKLKKTPKGTLAIHAAEIGGQVLITVSDNGKGFNIEKLKEAAIREGILTEKDLANLSEDAAMQLAFQSGISTSGIVTELSGRGLGLGIVSEKVDKLGGRLIVESMPNQGTTFKLYLPLTLATFRGILISVGNQDFLIPTHNVQRVVRIKRPEIKRVENSETIVVENRTFSFIHLGDLLGVQGAKEQNQEASLFALILKAQEKAIAFGVDKIHQESEVLVKGMGKQCIKINNILGATIMEWGKVIPILNPADLIRSAIKGELKATRDSTSQDHKVIKKILLVEDSLTTRLLLKNILEQAGFEVKMAVDGLEALKLLEGQLELDLLLTDVEMPGLDGFSLVEKTKKMNRYKDLPIVICTGRGSQQDRERGIEVGANGYIDKSSFTQQGLINIIQKLL